MKKLWLPWKTRNWLVGIGTDGAGSMLGQNNGLVAKLKMDMPDLISTHCTAHRLNLAVLNSIKDVSCAAEIDSVLKKLYSFNQYSPKRLKELEKVVAILKTNF
jgi:hypothetical protein